MRKIYLKKINIPKNAKVLDLGSYDGKQNKWMVKSGYLYKGIDLLKENKYVEKSDFVSWLKTNNEKFDLILAEFSLQQIKKKEISIVIKMIKQALNPKGYFYFSSFNKNDSFNPCFSQKDFLKMCNNFEIVSWNSRTGVDLRGRNRQVTELLLKKVTVSENKNKE